MVPYYKLPRYSYSDAYRSDLRTFSEERGLRLFHFTPIEQLGLILQVGLLPRRELETKNFGPLTFVDPGRALRGEHGATCLSIGHPNYKMLFTAHQALKSSQKTFPGFAIIELDSRVLWDLPWYAVPTNSARSKLNDDLKTKPEIFRGSLALNKLFMDTVETQIKIGETWLRGTMKTRTRLSLPPGHPTDPQAELLVDATIPPVFFKEILFRSEVELAFATNTLWGLLDGQSCRVEEALFGPRMDYLHWTDQRLALRRGR